MKLSERIKQVATSSTLAISQRAREMKKNGIDVVSFGAGEPDFDTPSIIREAAKEALDAGFTHYTPVAGTPELKNAISDYVFKNTGIRYRPDQIIATCGAKAAIFIALQVLVGPGDEVVIPAPYWVSYPEQVKLAGATPKIIDAPEKNGFKIDPTSLENTATEKTKLLILNSPSNPTGAVYSKSELYELMDFCNSKNIVIIADEIYDKLVFDGEFCSILKAHPASTENTVYVNGVSKSYAMTGWRMGFAAAPSEVISAMTKYQGQLYTNVTSFVQEAVITALKAPENIIEKMKTKFRQRRDLTIELLKGIPGVSCTVPAGAFYAFANVKNFLGKEYKGETIDTSTKLANFLLEEAHVAVVPGTGFGVDGYIRLSFATSEDEIKKGVTKIGQALTKLK